MGTSYSIIYNIFLSKITDYDKAEMSDQELLDFCDGIFVSAMTKIKHFENDLSLRNDVERKFEVELTSLECEVIASQMVVEWVDRKLNTTQLLHMFAGTKDENMASQANQIRAMMELKDNQRSIISALMRDAKYRAWIEEA